VTPSRTVRIAHAYGNRRDRLALALAADIDMIEADVWYHAGNVHVRHEHRLGRLPILIDRRSRSMPVTGPWALPLPRRYFIRPDLRPLRLGELLDIVGGRKRLLIDVKGSRSREHEEFAESIVSTIRSQGAGAWTELCGYWPVLDAVRRITPAQPVRYTVETPARLTAYLERPADGRASSGVCAYHRLLDRETMHILEAHSVDVFAWTVDDPATADDLVGRGVSGITSNDLGLLAGLPAAAHQAKP
jgi:glycerophosphoryl diester phosphodiesterase